MLNSAGGSLWIRNNKKLLLSLFSFQRLQVTGLGLICINDAHKLLWHQMPTSAVPVVRHYSKKAGAAKLRREVESDSDSDSDDEFERRRQKLSSKRSERVSPLIELKHYTAYYTNGSKLQKKVS